MQGAEMRKDNDTRALSADLCLFIPIGLAAEPNHNLQQGSVAQLGENMSDAGQWHSLYCL